MRCSNCDKEFDSQLEDCPHCGAVVDKTDETKVISARDRDGFSGITIVDDNQNEHQTDNQDTFYQRNNAGNQRVYVKSVNLSSTGLLTKLLILLALAFIIFILLPAFLIGFVVIAFIWFIFSLFR